MIRLVIVDDHPVVVSGLVSSLVTEPDMLVVGTARSLAEARQCIAEADPDVVLVDIRLPDGRGLELLEGGRPGGRPAWIVLSSFEDGQYVSAAIDLGASGYVSKTAPIGQLLAIIRTAATGGLAFEARYLELAGRARAWRITPRERDILRALVAGRSNDEIGLDLGLARKTVEGYLRHLFRRLGVGSRTELAITAVREGLVEAPPARPDDGDASSRRGG